MVTRIPNAPNKSPSAMLDYTRRWSRWLRQGESIASSSWSIEGPDSELTLGSGAHAATFDATSATCWLYGGTVGKTYLVTNHIVSDNDPPREDDRSFYVTIEGR